MNEKPSEPLVPMPNDPDLLVPMPNDPDLLPRYDFTHAVRGKYAARFDEGYTIRVERAGAVEETRLVRLPPDVAAAFSTDAAVHAALREWLQSRQDAL